jgi:hypothetical protein
MNTPQHFILTLRRMTILFSCLLLNAPSIAQHPSPPPELLERLLKQYPQADANRDGKLWGVGSHPQGVLPKRRVEN